MSFLVAFILVSLASLIDGQSPVCDQRDLRTLMVKINQLTAQMEETRYDFKAKLQETRFETTNLIVNANATFQETKGQIELTIRHINASVRSLSDTIIESEQNVNSSIDGTKSRLNTIHIGILEINNKTDTINSTVKNIKGGIKNVKDEIDRIKGLSQCPDGWVSYNRSCYFFSVEAKNFGDAAKACSDMGAHLVYVENNAENTFLKSFLRTLKVGDYWLGLTDGGQEGAWLFQGENSVPTFFDWYSGEPNNGGLGEHCAEFYSLADYVWNDHFCSELHFHVCEKNKLRLV